MKLLTSLLIVVVFATPATILVVFLYRLKKARAAMPLRLAGETGVVNSELNPKGSVLIDGELWPARSSNGNTIYVNQGVRVVGVENGWLLVEIAS